MEETEKDNAITALIIDSELKAELIQGYIDSIDKRDIKIKHLKELVESPWISVEDLLPGFGNYIVCLKNNSVMEMTFSDIGDNHWFKIGVGSEVKGNEVLSWMPLPKPPQK